MFLLQFLQQLDEKFGYAIDLRKYQQLLTALDDGTLTPDNNEESFQHVLRFCKILFLQDHKYEKTFNNLFKQEWDSELSLITRELIQFTAKKKEEPKKIQQTDSSSTEIEGPAKSEIDKPEDEDEEANDGEDYWRPESKDDDASTKTRYFHPEFEFQEENDSLNVESSSPSTKKRPAFIWHDTDEYYPVTKRQLTKAWQFLRFHEKGSLSTEIDIPATVNKLAREHLIADPVFKEKTKNRQNTLVIFSDHFGSMAPFHELSRRIIMTAREQGMHETARVFYYQNYPVDQVFAHPAMKAPVRLDKIYNETNPNVTLVLIISDAGAARGYHNSRRVEATTNFLRKLFRHVAHIVWLNPVPQNRWRSTSAEYIQQENPWLPMFPIFEEEDIQFQRIIQALFSGKTS